MRSFLACLLLAFVLAPLHLSLARDGQKRAAATTLPEFKIDRLKFKDAIKEWVKAAEKHATEKDRKRKQYSYELTVFTSLKVSIEPVITLQLKNVTAEKALDAIVDEVNKTGGWTMAVTWDTSSMKDIGRIGAPTLDLVIRLMPVNP